MGGKNVARTVRCWRTERRKGRTRERLSRFSHPALLLLHMFSLFDLVSFLLLSPSSAPPQLRTASLPPAHPAADGEGDKEFGDEEHPGECCACDEQPPFVFVAFELRLPFPERAWRMPLRRPLPILSRPQRACSACCPCGR